jgi:hypothetical protein
MKFVVDNTLASCAWVLVVAGTLHGGVCALDVEDDVELLEDEFEPEVVLVWVDDDECCACAAAAASCAE